MDRQRLVLAIIVIVLLGTNTIMIIQNLGLREKLEASKQLVTEVGYEFSTISAVDVGGQETQVSFSGTGKSTLLLVFNPSCEYCVQQYPFWKTTIGQLDPSRWQVIAITSEKESEGVREHLQKYDLASITTLMVKSEDLQRARLRFTPMTVVVDSRGEVSKVWPGLWKKGFDL